MNISILSTILGMPQTIALGNSLSYILHSVAQAFGDVSECVYAVKVQQPRHNWENIFGRAEDALKVLSEHYSLEPHRRGQFKTHNYGLAMGYGSSVNWDSSALH